MFFYKYVCFYYYIRFKGFYTKIKITLQSSESTHWHSLRRNCICLSTLQFSLGCTVVQVEKILDKSTKKYWNENQTKQEFEYQVKWVGWDKPNWEPESNLDCKFMLDTYELQKKVQKYKVKPSFNVEDVLQKYNLMPDLYEYPKLPNSNNGTIFFDSLCIRDISISLFVLISKQKYIFFCENLNVILPQCWRKQII